MPDQWAKSPHPQQKSFGQESFVGSRAFLYKMNLDVHPSYDLEYDHGKTPLAVQKQIEALQSENVAEANYTLPIPWMLFFAVEDFRPIPTQYGRLQMPCTSVEKARKRIEASLSIFVRLGVVAETGKEYWQEALDFLDALKYPYLAMSHLDYLSSFDDDDDLEGLFDSYRDEFINGTPDDETIAYYCASYTANVAPYTHEEWGRLVTRYDPHNARQMNAISLSSG